MTIDANVFVSALNSLDINFADSLALLNQVQSRNIRVYCPSLVLPECAGAVMRPTGNLAFTQSTIQSVRALPGMNFVSITKQRAENAAVVATNHRLRGADAVYVAVALEFNTTLVTWDKEVLARGPAAVATLTPTDWLAALTI